MVIAVVVSRLIMVLDVPAESLRPSKYLVGFKVLDWILGMQGCWFWASGCCKPSHLLSGALFLPSTLTLNPKPKPFKL